MDAIQTDGPFSFSLDPAWLDEFSKATSLTPAEILYSSPPSSISGSSAYYSTPPTTSSCYYADCEYASPSPLSLTSVPVSAPVLSSSYSPSALSYTSSSCYYSADSAHLSTHSSAPSLFSTSPPPPVSSPSPSLPLLAKDYDSRPPEPEAEQCNSDIFDIGEYFYTMSSEEDLSSSSSSSSSSWRSIGDDEWDVTTKLLGSCSNSGSSSACPPPSHSNLPLQSSPVQDDAVSGILAATSTPSSSSAKKVCGGYSMRQAGGVGSIGCETAQVAQAPSSRASGSKKSLKRRRSTPYPPPSRSGSPSDSGLTQGRGNGWDASFICKYPEDDDELTTSTSTTASSPFTNPTASSPSSSTSSVSSPTPINLDPNSGPRLTKLSTLNPSLICRIRGCRHVSRTKHECHKHRDTHFGKRWRCPNTDEETCGRWFGRSSSLARHLSVSGMTGGPCFAAAARCGGKDRKGWGVGLRKFEARAPGWEREGFELDVVEEWEVAVL